MFSVLSFRYKQINLPYQTSGSVRRKSAEILTSVFVKVLLLFLSLRADGGRGRGAGDEAINTTVAQGGRQERGSRLLRDSSPVSSYPAVL